MKNIWVGIFILMLLVFGPFEAYALSSASYKIDIDLLAGGGGGGGTASYQALHTTGQPSAIGISTATSFKLHAGFWHEMSAVLAPSILSATSTTLDGAYKAGDNINITVNFSEAVTSSGLILNLNSGGTVTTGALSNTDNWSGTYTASAGENSTDLSITTVSGQITSGASGNSTTDPGVPLGQNIADSKNIVIDTILPTVTGATSTTPDGAYKSGDNINITINFSESISTAGLTISLNSGATVLTGALSSVSSWSGTYTIGAGQNTPDLTVTTVAGTITDAAGNSTLNPSLPGGSNIGDLKNIVVDTIFPTVTNATSTTPDGAYKAGDNINITINFSEPVSSTGLTINLNSGATVLTGALSTVSSWSGTYTIGAGQNTPDLNVTSAAGTITDAAGNGTLNPSVPGGSNIGDPKNILVDTVAPAISISGPSAPSTISGPVDYTVTYTDTNFDKSTLASGNITLNKTGTADAATITVSGSGNTRTVTLSGISGSGTLGISIAAGTASDTAGNTAPAAGPSATFIVCTANSITVASPNDSGAGSLRQAIADICPNGTIDFSAGLAGQTVVLSSGELTINRGLTINGLTASPGVSVSGNNAMRVFNVSAGTVSINNLTIRDGLSATGAGLSISNAGTVVTLNNCSVINNSLTGINSGGGIVNNIGADLTMNNCTVSGNFATFDGGGIFNMGTLTINSSTITNNTANGGGGGGTGGGGGLENLPPGVVTLRNTIIAGNIGSPAWGPDCYTVGTTLQSSGYNMVGTTSFCLITPAATDTTNFAFPTLLLGTLQNNGGPTLTHALLNGSPAINAIPGCNSAPAMDQRGIARPQGVQCDIGAYEFVPDTTTTVVSSLNPSTYGDSVTFTATISDSETASIPTGTVTFKDGGVAVCTDVPVALGSAQCTTSTLGAGDHTLTAEYTSDLSFSSSNSASITQSVDKAAQSPLTFSPGSPLIYNTIETLIATGGSGTGAFSYQVDSGSCSISGGNLLRADSGTGSCSITATRAGDANYNAATATATVTLQLAAQAGLTLNAGTPLTYNTAEPLITGGGSGTGGVTYQVTTGPCTITGASNDQLRANSGTGSCSVTATKAADGNYNAATASGTVTLQKAATTTALNASVAFTIPVPTVTLTATISNSVSGAAPTGTVTFKAGGNDIAGCVSVAVVSGVATCITNALTPGVYETTAVYSGDANYLASSSEIVSVSTLLGKMSRHSHYLSPEGWILRAYTKADAPNEVYLEVRDKGNNVVAASGISGMSGNPMLIATDAVTPEVSLGFDKIRRIAHVTYTSAAGRQVVAVTGILAGIRQIVVTPEPLIYGGVTVGSGLTKKVTVRSTGNMPLNITGLGTPGAPFTIMAATTCGVGVPIPAGSSCNIVVKFKPTQVKTYSSSFVISTDGGNPTVHLNGTGQ